MGGRSFFIVIPIHKNQIWVTDITYIPIWNADGSYTFCYLSMITDCYTKEIISWYVGETMEAWCNVECLMKALETLDAEVAHPLSITSAKQTKTIDTNNFFIAIHLIILYRCKIKKKFQNFQSFTILIGW